MDDVQGKELQRRLNGELPDNWKALLPRYKPSDKADATRSALLCWNFCLLAHSVVVLL